jgi:hypothetical protein
MTLFPYHVRFRSLANDKFLGERQMGGAYVIPRLDTGDALADGLDDTRRLVAENLHTQT